MLKKFLQRGSAHFKNKTGMKTKQQIKDKIEELERTVATNNATIRYHQEDYDMFNELDEIVDTNARLNSRVLGLKWVLNED